MTMICLQMTVCSVSVAQLTLHTENETFLDFKSRTFMLYITEYHIISIGRDDEICKEPETPASLWK